MVNIFSQHFVIEAKDSMGQALKSIPIHTYVPVSRVGDDVYIIH